MLFFTKKTSNKNQTKNDQNPKNLTGNLPFPKMLNRKTVQEKNSIIKVQIRIENPVIFIFRAVSKEVVIKIITRRKSSKILTCFEKGFPNASTYMMILR
jgi:hypothetical protein